MRRFMAALLLALMLSIATMGSALGKVHGITPLGCMTHDPANAGANQTEDGPADSENGGPIISGLIPFGVGNAQGLEPGQGGRHSALCD